MFDLEICPYERKWETRVVSNHSTNSESFPCYVYYSCYLFFCKYPEKKCRVKQP